jgi:holo-[acyl-carrier protein] synthase
MMPMETAQLPNESSLSIFGIGTDIIELERVEIILSKDNGFRETVFTQNEIDYCENKANKTQNYAARFAAKEAFLKAIGTGWPGKIQFNEIEIINDHNGKPEIILKGNAHEYAKEKGITRIYLSISHLKDIAHAIVALQTNKNEYDVKIYSVFIDIGKYKVLEAG